MADVTIVGSATTAIVSRGILAHKDRPGAFPLLFNTQNKSYLESLKGKYFLGEAKEVNGDIYKLYPDTQIVEIRTSKRGKCKVVLNRDNFLCTNEKLFFGMLSKKRKFFRQATRILAHRSCREPKDALPQFCEKIARKAAKTALLMHFLIYSRTADTKS